MFLRDFIAANNLDENQVAKAIEEGNKRDGTEQPTHPNSKVRDEEWLKSITSHLSPVANEGGEGGESTSGDPGVNAARSEGAESNSPSVDPPADVPPADVPPADATPADATPVTPESAPVRRRTVPAPAVPESFRHVRVFGQPGEGLKPYLARWVQTGKVFGVYATDETDAIAIVRSPKGDSEAFGSKANPSFVVTPAE